MEEFKNNNTKRIWFTLLGVVTHSFELCLLIWYLRHLIKRTTMEPIMMAITAREAIVMTTPPRPPLALESATPPDPLPPMTSSVIGLENVLVAMS